MGLVVLTLAAYGQLWENRFINMDDELFVTKNPYVLAGLTGGDIAWAWTTTTGGSWIPLTWMSLQADASLSSFIQDPSARKPPLAVLYHGQNLFWHMATVVLLFVMLRRMTGSLWCSALVAALFGVHPLHVESVAWATERKDVLSTFFGVLALLAYSGYARQPTWGRYLLVLAAFVLSLLAKPMLLTLPFALLLLDWWPLGRLALLAPAGVERAPSSRDLGGLLIEKVPLLVITATFTALTILSQNPVTALYSRPLPLPDRLANAVASYGWYLEKTFWPTGLTIFYHHPLGDWQWQPVLISGSLLLGVTVLAVAGAKRWPWLLVGWLWFLGTLVPVIGVLQVGWQSKADRYSYVPHIGLFVAIVWSGAALGRRLRVPGGVLAGLATVCLLLLTAATWVQVGYWRNSEVLWRHAVAVTTNNHRAILDLGRTLFGLAEEGGDARYLPEARQHIERAIELLPGEPSYRAPLALVLFRQDLLEQAADILKGVIEQDPHLPRVWHTLGTIQNRLKKYQDAAHSLRKELEQSPKDAETHAELGVALWHLDQRNEAAKEWEQALEVNPAQPDALNGMGLVKLRQGKPEEARERFAAAVQVNLAFVEAWSNQGIALGRLRKWDEASKCQLAAVELEQVRLKRRPDSDMADLACYLRRLALALYVQGFQQAAAERYTEAAKKEPHREKPTVERAWRLATAADPAERDAATAWELASQVCQANPNPPVEALDALAAAQAALGHCDEAIHTAEQARARATPDLARAIEARILLYQKGKPFVTPDP
jgi:tetratricopeptide (TPR) repeat protein